MTDAQHIQSRTLSIAIWAMLAFLCIFDAVAAFTSGISIQILGLESYAMVMGVCFAAALIGKYKLHDANVTAFGIGLNQMIVAGMALGFYCYFTTRWNLPLRDEWFIRADAALGFDWRDLFAWMGEHSGISTFLSLCYLSFGVQIISMICLLYGQKQAGRAQIFIASFLLTGLTCITIAAIMPAVGAYVHYDINEQNSPHIPLFARIHEDAFLALRDHSMTIFVFPVKGILTFPSFHAAVATLLIYAGARLRYVRYFFLLLNIGMISSTPIDGGHYLVDLLAGIAIAITMLRLVTYVQKRTASYR